MPAPGSTAAPRLMPQTADHSKDAHATTGSPKQPDEKQVKIKDGDVPPPSRHQSPALPIQPGQHVEEVQHVVHPGQPTAIPVAQMVHPVETVTITAVQAAQIAAAHANLVGLLKGAGLIT